MTNQILLILAQQLVLVLVIASVTFLLGIIFEKQVTEIYEKAVEKYQNKKAEQKKLEYIAMKKQKEADKRKVQKIRDNYNREMENTGIICAPYYAAS